MRIAHLALAAALFAGPATAETWTTHAAPEVKVAVSAELMEKARTSYGVRDVERLAERLEAEVEQELARTGVLAGGEVRLTLADAQPTRPTLKQMGGRPGLSHKSFGLGGAVIVGEAIALDGRTTPINYRWYESDIRMASRQGTWTHAEQAISRFAHRLSRGQVYALR